MGTNTEYTERVFIADIAATVSMQVDLEFIGICFIKTNLSLPRRRKSSYIKMLLIPAFAGMTFLEVAKNHNLLLLAC